MPVRNNAELCEGTALVISEERAALLCGLNRRLIAMQPVLSEQDKPAVRMVAITVTIPTVIGNRHRTEVRPSIATVRASKSEVPLIKSSNVTLPLRARCLRVTIESPRRTFTSMPSIIFGL